MDRSDLDWAHTLLKSMDRARSLTVWLLLKYSEWGQLVNLNCDPSEYADFDGESFRLDYQATEFFRKITGVNTGIDTKAAAIASFWEAEAQCHRTNRRLRPIALSLSGPLHYGVPCWLQEFVRDWRKEVKLILGSLPKSLDLKFSSGSTFDDRRYILPMDKMSSRPTITADALGVIVPFWERTLWCKALLKERPHRSQPRVIRGNRFTTVPKSAKTDRGICVEPSLNVTHQLPVGSVIRKRLRRVGIDLKHGQDLHQRLVALASLTKALATIDLSSASDTISYELVKLILPNDWFDLLDSLRSKETCVYGQWHKNAKFSSMGNGFTFELETLIFYTLCVVIAKRSGSDIHSIYTYGDDIIVPRNIASEVLDALTYFGFTPNKRKTWVGDVPFRESCGEDYFNGIPVRGHYLESMPASPVDWIKLANGIRRMAKLYLSRFGDLGPYIPAWLRCIQHIPAGFRNFGPVHLGDTVIHTDDERWWITRVRDGKHELRVTESLLSESSYSRLDKPCWNRDSIVAAAVLGLLKDQGLVHSKKRDGTFKCYQPLITMPRGTVSGFRCRWTTFGHNNDYPEWIRRPEFGFRSNPEPA